MTSARRPRIIGLLHTAVGGSGSVGVMSARSLTCELFSHRKRERIGVGTVGSMWPSGNYGQTHGLRCASAAKRTGGFPLTFSPSKGIRLSCHALFLLFFCFFFFLAASTTAVSCWRYVQATARPPRTSTVESAARSVLLTFVPCECPLPLPCCSLAQTRCLSHSSPLKSGRGATHTIGTGPKAYYLPYPCHVTSLACH